MLKQEVRSENCKLNLLGWMVYSWDWELDAKRGNNRVMRRTFEKGNTDKVMDRTTALPKKCTFGENRQVHVLTREQASAQSCKLGFFIVRKFCEAFWLSAPYSSAPDPPRNETSLLFAMYGFN